MIWVSLILPNNNLPRLVSVFAHSCLTATKIQLNYKSGGNHKNNEDDIFHHREFHMRHFINRIPELKGRLQQKWLESFRCGCWDEVGEGVNFKKNLIVFGFRLIWKLHPLLFSFSRHNIRPKKNRNCLFGGYPLPLLVWQKTTLFPLFFRKASIEIKTEKIMNKNSECWIIR